jgi:hypothetical protein
LHVIAIAIAEDICIKLHVIIVASTAICNQSHHAIVDERTRQAIIFLHD